MGVLYAKVSGAWEPILNSTGETGGGGGDPGDIKATMATTPPAGWLMLNGQAVAGADALYPALWAVAPAAWKAGTTLNLPNATDCTLMGGGTLGAVGGANSRTLAIANLPAHDHTMSAHTHNIAHTHTINHDHASWNYTTPNPTAHSHTLQGGGSDGTAGYTRTASGGQGTDVGVPGPGNHTHALVLNVPSYSGSSGAASDAISAGPSAADTSSVGSGTALDTTPKHLRVNYVVKT